MTTENNIDGKIKELAQSIAPDEKLVENVMNRIDSKSIASPFGINTQNIRRIINKSPSIKLAAAAVIIIAAMIGIIYFCDSIGMTSPAFGEVLEKLARIQTLHAKLITNGKEAEVWAKRPNMLRFNYADGNYEISKGTTIWIVDVKNNKATQKPSWYYKDAQQRGIDVLDALVNMEYTDNFSGFFSEGPVKRIKKGNKSFDVYQMKFEEYDDRIDFEAIVDSEILLIKSMKIKLYDTDQLVQSFELNILDYDKQIPDSTFVFKPSEGMQVVVEEPEATEATPIQTEGSTLSGRIIWASSRKPVSGARLTFRGGRTERTPDGKSRHKYFVRAETDRNGEWQITGAPAGSIRMSVRSWEFEWPAMPTFTTNVVSPLHPTIIVDGQSEYSNLNFKVYKPKDLFARIKINVKDENGNPVEGASAFLQYAEAWVMHQHVYATPRKRQFSGPDGKFDNASIWPSIRPVKLSVSPRDPNCPYPIRGIYTEPFIIEPKQHHNFDIVLPYKREISVKVVDFDHKPLEGIAVSVLDQNAFPIFPLRARDPAEILFTDSDGLADVSGMFPGENIIIALKRLDAQQPDPGKPLAFACIFATAPKNRDKPIVEFTFDERPITVQGSIALDSKVDSAWIFIKVTDKPGDNSLMVLRTKVDENGKFILQGVPAGKIRICYSCRIGQDGKRGEGTITTEPGNNYTVKLTEKGLQLIDQKTNP